jgi:hypothetical protein
MFVSVNAGAISQERRRIEDLAFGVMLNLIKSANELELDCRNMGVLLPYP